MGFSVRARATMGQPRIAKPKKERLLPHGLKIAYGILCFMSLIVTSSSFGAAIDFRYRRDTWLRAVKKKVQTQSDVESAFGNWEYVMFFDGGSRGNPGPGGCGALVKRRNMPVWEAWAYLEDDKTTNNVAEYAGLLLGIKGLTEKSVERCLICGDSKLILNQLCGLWRCKDAKLAALRARAVEGLKDINFEVLHVSREFNSMADDLANRAMDTRSSGSNTELIRDGVASDERRAALRRERDAAHAALDSVQAHVNAERERIDAQYKAALGKL